MAATDILGQNIELGDFIVYACGADLRFAVVSKIHDRNINVNTNQTPVTVTYAQWFYHYEEQLEVPVQNFKPHKAKLYYPNGKYMKVDDFHIQQIEPAERRDLLFSVRNKIKNG